MGDLQIDPAALAQVRTKLVSVEALLDSASTRMAGVTAAAVGPPTLVSRVGTFGEDWTDALDGLSTFAESLGRSLDVAEQAMDDLDEALAGSGPV